MRSADATLLPVFRSQHQKVFIHALEIVGIGNLYAKIVDPHHARQQVAVDRP